MQHQIGRELTGRRFGFHALDQLAAGRAYHLDADERKLLAEFVDDLLLDLGEGRGIEDELAFLAGRVDETVGRLVGRCGPRAPDDRERADACGSAQCLSSGQFTNHNRALPRPAPLRSRPFPASGRGTRNATADSRTPCSTPRPTDPAA